ncbi:MAG: hypothetical protein NC205_02720 [Prevotella sp.]|nr:hypothetical protein [Alistipes senegalensis]MCM1357482.1 hypothetical protein [Prevotella sp.]
MAIALLIITAGVIIALPLIKKDAVPEDIIIDDVGEKLKADPNAGKYVEPDKQEEENDGVSVPGWSSLDFPANTSEVAVDFFNPEENEGRYSLTFELRLPDESEQGYEVLYTSGLVDAGLHIQQINLSRGLDAGVYDAIIHVQPYRTDENQTATNNADLKTKLVVS